MSAATINPNYIDVEFSVLNDLASRLRTAGAKIRVRKIGHTFRITLVQQPTLTTVEQILSYANQAEHIENPSTISEVTEKTREVSASKNSPSPFSSPSETADTLNPPELATLENLQTLPLEKLRGFAKLHKVSGFSKMKPEKLVAKLHGLVTKQQLV